MHLEKSQTATTYSPGSTISYEESTAELLIGPIIGKVTDSTARILIEVDQCVRVAVVLTSASSGKVKTKSHLLSARRPRVFQFSGLEINAKYFVTFRGVDCRVPSAFTTFSGRISKELSPKFVAISGNDFSLNEYKPSKDDLWHDLAHRLSYGDLDYLLHLGGQVSLTSKSQRSVSERVEAKYSSKPFEEWYESIEDIREVIRTEYRSTWTHPSTRKVLANVPNLMIAGEDEILQGFRGLENQAQVRAPWEFFWSQQARFVYYEYQRQLWENVNFDDLSQNSDEYHYHALGDFGIFFLDTRLQSQWQEEKNPALSSLSHRQWSDLESAFSLKGRFSKCKSILLLSSSPLFFTSKPQSREEKRSLQCLRWHHNFLSVSQEKRLISILRGWKKIHKHSNITALCGGLCIGGRTEVHYQNNLLLNQLTVSSVSGLSAYTGRNLLQIIPKTTNRLDNNNKRYKISNANWVNCKAYLLAQWCKLGDEVVPEAKFITELITVPSQNEGDDKMFINEIPLVKRPVVQKRNTGCCSFFRKKA